MALTYEESALLMNDFNFRGRIKVACLKYADFIILEAAGTPGHTGRLRWAQSTYQNPEQSAIQVQPPVVMDPSVQADGANIADGALQSAVENTVNKFI